MRGSYNIFGSKKWDIDKRHEIAEIYDQEFKDNNIQKPFRDCANKSALHLYVIQVEPAKHKRVFQALREKNIGVNLHYIPVHTQPYYQAMGFSWGDFPNSEAYYKKAISLPMFSTFSAEKQRYVINTVKALCNE